MGYIADVMKLLMPEPTNCTPMHMRMKPMSFPNTAMPEGPKCSEQYSLERSVS